MNSITLKLKIDGNLSIDARQIYEKGIFHMQLFGVDYQVSIDSMRKVTTPNYGMAGGAFWSGDLTIEGWAVDKKAKELSEAKEVVRKKQQEFKDAQRKLSELMRDNK